MVLIQSLIINFLVIFLFLQIGNFFSNKFKLEEYYEKILFGFSIFTLFNFFFYFVFYFSVKKIIFIWIITLVCIFFSNIFYSRKLNFIKFGLSVSKFIIPIISRFGSFVNHSDQASSKLMYLNGAYYAVSTKKLRKYKDEITLDYNALPWFLEGKKHWYI